MVPWRQIERWIECGARALNGAQGRWRWEGCPLGARQWEALAMVDTNLLERVEPSDPALRWTLHLPQGEVRRAVLITHGYAEHQGRYDRVVRGWTDRGLAVCTYDLRGHGGSEGPRGHIVSFHDYVHDLMELVDHLGREPRWSAAGGATLFGHSLGGLIALHAALTAPNRFRSLALTSPFLGLSMQVPAYKRVPAQLLSTLIPRLSMPSGLAGRDVTRDVDLARAYDDDPLIFKHATARWFTEVMEAQRVALRRAPELKLPLAALLAGDDRVASTQASRRALDAISSAQREVKVVDGAYHEILSDPDRDTWIGWLADRMLDG
jgi:alpha-beta hydrolase superfamily lysophospholipase